MVLQQETGIEKHRSDDVERNGVNVCDLTINSSSVNNRIQSIFVNNRVKNSRIVVIV
jgi:hypothetical protein